MLKARVLRTLTTYYSVNIQGIYLIGQCSICANSNSNIVHKHFGVISITRERSSDGNSADDLPYTWHTLKYVHGNHPSSGLEILLAPIQTLNNAQIFVCAKLNSRQRSCDGPCGLGRGTPYVLGSGSFGSRNFSAGWPD